MEFKIEGSLTQEKISGTMSAKAKTISGGVSVGGGIGVQSVNNKLPDAKGNVQIGGELETGNSELKTVKEVADKVEPLNKMTTDYSVKGLSVARNITGTRHKSVLQNIIVDTHPENGDGSFIPFLSNDIAYVTLRGGSCTVNKGEVDTKMFDGSPSYAVNKNFLDSGLYVVEVTLHKTFYHRCLIGVHFGISTWASKYVKIECFNKAKNEWVLAEEISNNNLNICQKDVNYLNDGISKLRFTFDDFRGLFRIAQLYLVNYDSLLFKEPFLGRDGGAMYGNLNLNPYDLNVKNVNYYGALVNASDSKLKKDIRPVNNCLEKVCKLNECIRHYRYLNETNYAKGLRTGFVADLLEKSGFEGHVIYRDPINEAEGALFGWSYKDEINESGETVRVIDKIGDKVRQVDNNLTPYLYGAVAELAKENESLKTRLENIEKRLGITD